MKKGDLVTASDGMLGILRVLGEHVAVLLLNRKGDTAEVPVGELQLARLRKGDVVRRPKDGAAMTVRSFHYADIGRLIRVVLREEGHAFPRMRTHDQPHWYEEVEEWELIEQGDER